MSKIEIKFETMPKNIKCPSTLSLLSWFTIFFELVRGMPGQILNDYRKITKFDTVTSSMVL